MHEKIGSWSLVLTKSRDQENYLSCYQGLLVRGDSDVFEVLQCQIL
jgi:hypothetical protein